MINLIYGSSATEHFDPKKIGEFLEKIRAKNLSLGITGILLYHNGNFLQVLEGERDTVIDLFTRIKLDPRHRHIIEYVRHEVTKRQFGDWQMGFINLHDVNLKRLDGYSDYLQDPLSPKALVDTPSYAKVFLEVFRENIR